jgi:hypothetical protein
MCCFNFQFFSFDRASFYSLLRMKYNLFLFFKTFPGEYVKQEHSIFSLRFLLRCVAFFKAVAPVLPNSGTDWSLNRNDRNDDTKDTSYNRNDWSIPYLPTNHDAMIPKELRSVPTSQSESHAINNSVSNTPQNPTVQ